MSGLGGIVRIARIACAAAPVAMPEVRVVGAAASGALRLITASLVLAAFGLASASAAAPSSSDPLFEQPPPGVPNFTGKWEMTKHITRLLTTDGREPPLNAAGRSLYAKRQAALKSGDRSIDPLSHCWLHGVPRLLYAPYPFLILQTTRSVDFVHEVNHTFRVIYWDKALPDDPDPDWLGYSIARLEGRTLVIDSTGFNDETWLDYSGLPHGERLRVQERYTLASPTRIDGTVRITDPQYYTAPWTTRFTLKRQPGMDLKENVCTDTHRM